MDFSKWATTVNSLAYVGNHRLVVDDWRNFGGFLLFKLDFANDSKASYDERIGNVFVCVSISVHNLGVCNQALD